MYFYFGLAVFSLICSFLVRDKACSTQRKRYLMAVFSVLIFFACFRGSNVGTDTESYINTYNAVKYYGVAGFGLDHSIEYGYFAVVSLLTKISAPPQTIIIFFTGLTYLIIAHTIYKHSSNVVMSTFLFIVWVLPSTLNGMRQHFALALFMVAISEMLKEKHIKALLLIVLAVTFHNSAVIFIPFLGVYFIIKKWPGIKGVMILSLACTGLFFIVDRIIVFIASYIPRYAHYLTTSYYDKVGSTNQVWIFIYMLFILMYFIIIKNKCSADSYDGYHEKANVYYLIFVILQIFVILLSNNARGIFQRLSVYSGYGVIFLMPYVMDNFFIYSRVRLNNRSIQIVKGAFYIAFLLFDIMMLKQNPHFIIPYTFL